MSDYTSKGKIYPEGVTMSDIESEVNEAEALDDLFTLAPEITDDPKLVNMFSVLCTRMCREVAHLPVLTLHYLLIERINTNYVIMREKEKGNLRGYGTITAQKSFNTFWLALTQEFNKLIISSDQKRQKQLLENVRDIVISVLNGVDDRRVKSELLDRFSTAFDQAGV